MEFKKGDVVYLDKRGLIGWETVNVDRFFEKNRPYMISSISVNTISIYDYNVNIHPEHFKIHDIINDEINGDKFFKIGDKVRLECRGKIGWERNDYTTTIQTDKIYEVSDYVINSNSHKFMRVLDYNTYIHPNHFKKVE